MSDTGSMINMLRSRAAALRAYSDATSKQLEGTPMTTEQLSYATAAVGSVDGAAALNEIAAALLCRSS
jgi:hypothetical protein